MDKASDQVDIIGHIVDTDVIELFYWHIKLPSLHAFGMEFQITKFMVMMSLAAALLLLILIPVARKRPSVPSGLYNAVEAFLVFIRDNMAVALVGPKGVIFVPYLATLFLFILTCNLLGLVPFGATATGTINVTGALALMSFLLIHSAGFREHGGIGYFKAMVPGGVPLVLFPFILFIEIVGHFAKTISLTIRLFANMMAGHIVLLAILSVIFIFKNIWIACMSVGGAVALSCLEILVAFIQAFIFTYLTAVFLGMAVHEH